MACPSLERAERNFDFKSKLLSIAKEITADALEDMLFICDLPAGVKESISEPITLFKQLLTRSKISPDDVTHLVKLLENTGNEQLAQRVKMDLGEPATLDKTNYCTFPPLTNDFIGREELVEDIVTKLTRETKPVRMVVIVAIPGMGKTQVAIAVGHDLLKRKESITVKKVIFIVKQESLTDLCTEIIRGVSGRNLSESHDLVSIAKDKLRSVKSGIIIILDNTEGLQKKQKQEFDSFVEYVILYAANVQLIITTREDLGCQSLNIYKEPLGTLDWDPCARLIRTSVCISDENAQEIGKLCGGIPLLLVHCVVLLKSSFKPESLIEWLKNNPIPLLKKNAKEVYEALGGFLGNMPKSLLENLIKVSVFPSAFSVNDISQILFEDDKLESETVKTTMVGCSILQRMENDKYALHPLVRQYCRAERNVLGMEDVGRSAQGKFNRYYIEKLKTWSKNFITKDSAMSAITSFKKCKENLMDALWNCLEEKSNADEKTRAVDVANSTEVLDFLAKVLSPPAKCLEFYEKCHAIARESGDQKRLADSLSALGFLHLANVGHLTPDQQSLDKLKEAKRIRETLPKEQQNCHAHGLTLSKLGLCYALRGQQQEGLELIERGITLKKELGVPLYLAAGFCDLGNAYRKGDDHHKAIEIWEEKTLAVYQDTLGEHPWTATILTLIAGSCKALAGEKIDRAVEISREALVLRENLLGVHRDTARSHVLLSDALCLQNNFESALGELEKALEIQQEVLGEDNDNTKNTREKMKLISTRI